MLELAGNNILFDNKFWKKVEGSVNKIKVKVVQVYEIVKKVDLNGIKKGDFFHLDTLHLNEIDVYDSQKKHKAVYDLNGNKTGDPMKGKKCG